MADAAIAVPHDYCPAGWCPRCKAPQDNDHALWCAMTFELSLLEDPRFAALFSEQRRQTEAERDALLELLDRLEASADRWTEFIRDALEQNNILSADQCMGMRATMARWLLGRHFVNTNNAQVAA